MANSKILGETESKVVLEYKIENEEKFQNFLWILKICIPLKMDW